ncbi:M60 family metallopeptidase, partial [Clostridium tertium]
PATQVYKGISKGVEGDIDAQVDRMYNNVLAWEQMIQITNAKKGVYENEYVAGDLNNDGVIDNKDKDYYNKNRAPKNRVNIKYQRMFIGAFMYASGHHVGIEYGSSGEMLGGVPYKFDENGKITNADEAQLFGWGIGHDIGHKADIAKRTYSETTNNILALIAQT